MSFLDSHFEFPPEMAAFPVLWKATATMMKKLFS
jgi:hypothetical protein